MRKIRDRFFNSKGKLTQQVITGSFWVMMFQASSKFLSLITKIILARILSPSDFGLFGIAMIALSAIEKFSLTGFDHALIQKNKKNREYLDSAWTIQIARGLLIALILYFCAPLVAFFFRNQQAIPLIRMVALIEFIGSFRNIGIVYFQKELNFKREFTYQFSSAIVDFSVSLICAIVLRSAWAFIFGFLARNFTLAILSYVLHPFRPKLLFAWTKIKELFSFGKWMLLSSIFSFLITEGDDILVGRMLGESSLGFYKQSYLYSNLPATQITNIISKVTFPAYSKLKNDIIKVREAFFKVMRINAMVSLPVSGLIFVLGANFVHTILGEKWIPMIPAMQVLALWGAIRAIGATTGPLFKAIGKPYYVSLVQGLRLVLIAISIIPMINSYNILGASIVITITGLIFRPITDFIASRSIKAKFWQYTKIYLHPMLSSVLSSVLTYFVLHKLFSNYSIWSLITCCIIFIISYIPILYITEYIFGFNYLRTRIKGLRNSD